MPPKIKKEPAANADQTKSNGVPSTESIAAGVSFKKVRGKRGVRFVRAGTKDATVKDVTIGAHSIRIPPRPYLGINDVDQAEIEIIAADAVRREADL